MDTTYPTQSSSSMVKLERILTDRPVILQLLRFAAIGSLNTALDFIILNLISKFFGIDSGLSLGSLNVIGFSAAILQSYFWNRAWTFTAGTTRPIQNAIRLMLVGGLGFVTFLAVVIGASQAATPLFYLIALILFVAIELSFWFAFRLSVYESDKNIGQQFLVFLVISIIGLLINSVIVSIASSYLAPNLPASVNADTVKNIAKVLATCVSLIWNFIGYKLVVFRR